MAVEDRSVRVAGFKNQTHIDPFLSSSGGGEQLTEVRSDYNPDHHSPSVETTGSESYRIRGPMSMSQDVHQGNRLGLMDGYQHIHINAHSANSQTYEVSPHSNITPQSYTGTSPSNGYSSDLEYTGIDEYAQDFENNFLLEAAFGPLPIPEDSQDLSLEAEALPEVPASANSITSGAISYASRRSTGLATHSSHLMSPSLTESASPGSGTEINSPPMKARHIGGGYMSRVSSQSTGTETGNRTGQTAYTHHTPALTGSSLEVTPEPAGRRGIYGNASPVVRVESYSRGDSPARSTKDCERRGSKRGRGSRSSSHLAAPRDDSSEESDEDTYVDRSRGLQTSAELRVSAGTQDLVDPREGLDPFRRSKVSDEQVLNFQDQAEKADLDAKHAEVSNWLATTEVGAQNNEASHPIGARRYRSFNYRRRAKSTSDQRDMEQYVSGMDDSRRTALSDQIPGPGVLVYEDSGDDAEDDEDSRSYAESAPASVDGRDQELEDPGLAPVQRNGEMEPQDAHPWVDPFYVRSQEDTVGQPSTSNQAMMRFLKRNADLETASRVATWGTVCRRLSEGDLDKIIGREGLLSRLSISKDKGKGKDDRRGSFFENAAAKLLSKRTPSNTRRKTSEPTKPLFANANETDYSRRDGTHGRKESLHGRKESLGNRAGSPSVSTGLRRIPSINKNPKSPKINTGSAIAAVATHIAALGGNGSISPTAASSPTGAWVSARNALKRTIGGDFHRPTSNETTEPGLADLWNKQGGPPLPTLTSPPEDREIAGPFGPHTVGEDDAESDEVPDEKGVSMDFMPRDVQIIPTFDGFKINVREINPRLEPYLVERLGQEQLRRYKKLVEFKVKHAQAQQHGNCESGAHCPNKGGVPTYFPPKASQKEPRHSHTGFSTVMEGELDEDEEAVAEGAVTAAQFPPGVPMPPAKRLPAQFECPLCFTVKKFQKPSDWSKHVHEDLQPFTCTFPTCPDPKSFKRKADWVRHENERHRQLEWWTCTEDGCSHQCYRRDNFVQHLVREHKMPEPKAKNSKPNKPAVRGPAKNKARINRDTETNSAPEDRVLMMIDTCRHETPNSPSNEPCRFCGNVCNSWKKLTVHLARHMEQISMPVLDLVKQKDVSPDTIISPIEQKLSSQSSASPMDQPQHVRVSSTGALAYDQSTRSQNIKQELPSSFTPLNGPVMFHAPNYENQVTGTFPWGQQNSNSLHVGSHGTTPCYDHADGNAYFPNSNGYQHVNMTQYIPGSSHPRFPQTSLGSNAQIMFGDVSEQASQVPQNNFSTAHPYGRTMEHPTQFRTQDVQSEYMIPSDAAHSQLQQLPIDPSLSMHLDSSVTIPFSPPPKDSSHYHVPQQNFYYQ